MKYEDAILIAERVKAEMNETNLYMLPPFFQEYTRKCWERWGLYDHEN